MTADGADGRHMLELRGRTAAGDDGDQATCGGAVLTVVGSRGLDAVDRVMVGSGSATRSSVCAGHTRRPPTRWR